MVLQDTRDVIFPERFGDSGALLLGQRNASVLRIHALLPVEVARIWIEYSK